MRILQVTNTYYPELKFGGPPQKIHALGRRLVGRGHAVTVLTFDSENPRAADRRMVDGVAVEYLRWRGWGLRQWPVDEKKIALAVENADLIHGYGLYNFLCPKVAKLARQKQRPYVVEPLGMYQPRAGSLWRKRIYHRLFTARMFQGAATVVAASALELEELADAVPKSRLVLRRNGIDVELFQHLPPPDKFRNRFGIAPGERVVLYLGRLSPVKNLEDLVRAFHQTGLAQCRLVLAGPENEPDYAARLRALVRSLDLETKVVFAGPLFDADKLSALAAAELFVLPSLSESFGNAAAEAVAAGIPVLLTQTCGIAALVHQRAGLAIPLGVTALADGLRVMLAAGQRKPFLQQRAEVIRELSWDEPVAQTERLYAAILGQPPAGAANAW